MPGGLDWRTEAIGVREQIEGLRELRMWRRMSVREGVGHVRLQGDPEVGLVQWEDVLDRMEHVHPGDPPSIAEVADQPALAVASPQDGASPVV